MRVSNILSSLFLIAAALPIFIHAKTLSFADSNDFVTESNVRATQTSNFRTGATLTQYSLDPWGDEAAVSKGKNLLESSTRIAVQHLHGFGGVFPRTEDGTMDWESMDNRFGKALAGVDNQVLTACCAPAYIEENPDDEFSPYLRPKPGMYTSYADTVVKTVQRYKSIQYIQVWNEMKGFWNGTKNRWDYEAYTEFYNIIWDAVKAVRPDIRIGGPYVVVNSNADSDWDSDVGGAWGHFDQRDLDVITYWLKNKKGADFITVDGKNRNKDKKELVDPFERTKKFDVFMKWLRGLDETTYPGCKALPLWWAEWYAQTDDDTKASQAHKNAIMATGLIRTLRSGARTAIIWGPQGDQDGNSFPLGLFSDTRNPDGGQATPFYPTQKYLHDHFSDGMAYEEISGSNDAIEMLMGSSHLLLVNMTETTQTTTIESHTYTLGGYEVRLETLGDIDPPAPPTGLSVEDHSNGA